jgi:transposase
MSNRRFEMYQYRQIIVRLRSGDSARGIARAGLADRKKVKKVRQVAQQEGWLDVNSELPSDELLAMFFSQKNVVQNPSSLLPHQKRIEEWYRQGIQATTIHAALQRQYGFIGSYHSVQRLVKKLKNQSPAVTTHLEFKPGEYAQVDFGAGPSLVDDLTGEIFSTWIFVMVLAWSRHLYAEIVRRQDVMTWLGCHRRAFEWFNGVPFKVTIDNPKCAITKACYYDPIAQRSYAEYAEGYGFIIAPCPPRDPQKKGRIEAGVKYVKNNFLPLRTFRHLVDANVQLKQWLLETAGNRIHGSTHEKPLTLFSQTECFLLKPLPAQPPEYATWAKVTVHGDCHVQFLKCRYSVPYRLVHQLLWLRASETTVRIYQEHTLVAVHPRLFKPGSHHTVPDHLPPNALAYAMQDSHWCLEQARGIGPYCEQLIQQLLTASVVDYLRAAQGIVRLQKTYGQARLNAACRRALVFQSPQYRTVKSILKQGLEYEPLPTNEAFDALADSYTGKGRFCRNTTTLLQ